MIAKRIPAPKGGSGFGRLAAYVAGVKGRDDPASWARLNSYVLDVEHGGEKVAWHRVSNCQTNDAGWAVKVIQATQRCNKRATTDKSYHLVVSFPEGERPGRRQMEDIEDRLCAAIGFKDHQRISAVHQNTDNWHLHVAINRVHPVTHKAVNPGRDWWRLQQACAELEVEHGLQREVHSRNAHEAARKSQGLHSRPINLEREVFLREHAAAVLTRETALTTMDIRQLEYRERLKAFHDKRFRHEKARPERGPLRRDAFAHLSEQKREDWAALRVAEREERRRVLAAHPLPAWRPKDAERLQGQRRGREGQDQEMER